MNHETPEFDIIKLTKIIFSNPPKEPNSIHLDFTDFGLEELFQQLLMMFTEGMKMFYGDNNGKVDLTRLSENDFSKIQKYFQSFGFDVSYKIKPLNYFEPSSLNTKKELKDHCLRLRTQNCIYIVSFDYYKNPSIHNNCHTQPLL